MSGHTSMMAEQVVLWSDKFQIMLLKLFSSLQYGITLQGATGVSSAGLL